MNITKFIAAAAMAAAILSVGAHAQSTAQALAPSPQVTPTPNEVIYLPQLPTAADLVNAAAASHGVSIQKIDQTSTQITVVYKYVSGQTLTVAYNLIAAADSGAVPAPGVATVPAPATPAPAVAYAVPAPYYYGYGPDYAYYPAWYPPIAIGLDLGWDFRGGWGRGGWGHGGWGHGGGHWR